MLCGAPANSSGYKDPGEIHSAVLTNLNPDTRYYYQYGDSYGMSSEYSFVSTPPLGEKNEYTVILLGDMGASDTDGSYFAVAPKYSDIAAPQVTAAVANETNANLVILVGDIAYADGYLSKWESWHSEVQEITASKAFLVAQGNHDRDWPGTDTTYTGPDSGGECGVVTEYQMPMPLVSKSQPWWSFNYGLIHFVVMNTELNFTTGSAQYNWLLSDLSNVNRQMTPYTLVTGHRPMYCNSNESYTTRGANGNIQVQAQLQLHIEPLFKRYQVPLAFWGHSHTYQRTCAVWNQTCLNAGTTHYVLGISGRILDGNTMVQSVTPIWIDNENLTTHGYMRATVNPKRLLLEYVTVSTSGVTQVADSYSITPATNLATSRAALAYFPLFVILLLISILR